MTAAAPNGCEYPPGERHALLVFAASLDRDAAFDLARHTVEEHGWTALDATRCEEAVVAVDEMENETLRAAAKAATEWGYHVVCYPQPLTPRESRHRN